MIYIYMLELACIVFPYISYKFKKGIACIMYNLCIYTAVSVLVQVLHQIESNFFLNCNCCILQSLNFSLLSFEDKASLNRDSL